MATPTADKLGTYFPSHYIAADGNALTEYVVDSATLRNMTDAVLNEADDYWNGALGWFVGDTLAADLRGCFFHVKILTRPVAQQGFTQSAHSWR